MKKNSIVCFLIALETKHVPRVQIDAYGFFRRNYKIDMGLLYFDWNCGSLLSLIEQLLP